jgi:hypothetical protein
MTAVRFLVAMPLVAIMVSPLRAAESFIGCPVDQLDVRVTTNLPADWWATPQRGALLGTEIRRIGGVETLVCNYRAFGASAGVMREAPAALPFCTAVPTGFRCSGVAAGPVGGGGGGGGGSGCPDPAAFDFGLKRLWISIEPATGAYFFRLEGEVRNVGGADYSTAPNQQTFAIHELRPGQGPRILATESFGNLAPGESHLVTADVSRWKTDDEGLPDYRLSIAYDPDIRFDGNRANDDCAANNNSTTLRAADINRALPAGLAGGGGPFIRP